MAKKILSIVIAAIMLMSTVAVSSFAVTDYKKEIDTEFLHAYDYGEFDEERLEQTLYFWDDEVIADYRAATTNADYEALYNKMNTPKQREGYDPDEYTDFWYEHRDESKATVNYNIVLDKPNAKAGETVVASIYATANFWNMATLEVGVMYDKSRLTATATETGDLTGWMLSMELLDYGFPVPGRDMRDRFWPQSLQNDDAKSKYSGVKIIYEPDVNYSPYAWAQWLDNTLIAKFTFQVKDDAPKGAATIFVPTDGCGIEERCDDYADMSVGFLNMFFHGTDNKSFTYIDEMYPFGQTLTANNPSVNVIGDVENADYTALDAATQAYDAAVADKDLYTPDSWSAYESAATAAKNLSRDLTSDEQATVNSATSAVTNAKDALVLKEIISAAPTGTATLNSNANINLTVAGSPEKVRLVDSGLNSTTFSRDQATIVKDGNNEIWTVKYYASKASEELTAYVSYDGTDYLASGKSFTLLAEAGLDLTIHSLEVADFYKQDDKNYLTSGRHNIVFTTSTDVIKIQLVDAKGNTWTYSQATYPTSDEGNVRTWTINHNFCQLGDCTYTIRTRAKTTSFATTGDALTATVLY